MAAPGRATVNGVLLGPDCRRSGKMQTPDREKYRGRGTKNQLMIAAPFSAGVS